jgi:hypothetical protein
MRPTDLPAAIPNLSALVVGDICLDRWCIYDPATSSFRGDRRATFPALRRAILKRP